MRDDRGVKIHEAKPRLLTMLADTGVSPGEVTAADVRTVVDVFRTFAMIVVDDVAPVEEGDGVLAQYGTYNFRGSPEFSSDLTRQFSEPGEDGQLWQLGCTLYWDPSPETTALGSGDQWSFGMAIDDFFADAMALPGWAWALTAARAPKDLEITIEEV